MEVGTRVRTKPHLGWTDEDRSNYGNKLGTIVPNLVLERFRDEDEFAVLLDGEPHPLMFMDFELEIVD